MMDYGSLLDIKTKKRVLMDKFEDQKNQIMYYVEDNNSEQCVELLESLVSTMDGFLKEEFSKLKEKHIETEDQF